MSGSNGDECRKLIGAKCILMLHNAFWRAVHPLLLDFEKVINKSERRQSEPQTKRRAAQRRKLDETHPRLVVNLQAAATRKQKIDGGHVLRQSRHSLLVGAHAKLRERAINCAARGITLLQKARRFREPHIFALEDRRVAMRPVLIRLRLREMMGSTGW